MSSPRQDSIGNRLLAFVSAEDFDLLAPNLEWLRLRRGAVLIEAGAPIDFVYLPEAGLASQLAVTPDNRRMEVGIYGRDGIGPSSALLGIDREPHQHIVQGEGEAYRIPIGAFKEAVERSRTLHALLLRFVFVFTIQTGYTALSNGSDVIAKRLARWLLMCQDRIDGDDLPVTHEFLGIMLGVRRSGVTEALHILEGMRVIRATRGHVQVLDRERLQDIAGDSYGVPEAEYQRHLGPMRREPSPTAR
jgi:CRP-like cAMP-binding protein